MSEHVLPEGTVTVAGQVGSLITLLDRVICLGEAVTEVSGPAFTSRSAEARTEGGTPFTAFSAVGEIFYAGHDFKFTTARMDLATLGVLGGSSVVNWEYWNGSSWAALTVTGTPTGAKDFTADGELSWTAPADWAKNQVNAGPNMYHIRARLSGGAMSTAPTVNHFVHSWTIYDDAAGTNQKVYKSIGEDGASNILWDVNDNSPFSASPLSAGCRLWESFDAGTHVGTAGTPTAAQLAAGALCRKSATADATARAVYAAVSRDRVILAILSGDTADEAVGMYAGKLATRVAGDAFPLIIVGNADQTNLNQLGAAASAPQTAVAGRYLQRAYTGSGGSQASSCTMLVGVGGTGNMPQYPNGPDGALLTTPVPIFEGTAPAHLRGEWLGVDAIHHTIGAAIANGDVYNRVGSRFTAVKLRGNASWHVRYGLRGAA